MWHVAVGWHAIEFAQTFSQSVSGTLDRPRVVAPSKTCGHVRSSRRRWRSAQCRPRSAARHIGILLPVSILTNTSWHVILHQSAKFYPNRTAHGRKNDLMSIFKMADLRHFGFYRCNNVFFRKPMYDHSFKLLRFLRKSRFYILETDRLTD